MRTELLYSRHYQNKEVTGDGHTQVEATEVGHREKLAKTHGLTI